MRDLILELRRRSVFRAAGIYVAAAWILIEGASVILPNFGVPDAAMRWLVITAFIGFPIAMVLAWVFDLTEQGLQRTDDAADDVPAVRGVQKGDFIAIFGLSIALMFSMYLNVRSDPATTTIQEPLTILVSGFDNVTDNRSTVTRQLERVLQHAFEIDIEAAPFISSYDRFAALSMSETSLSDGTRTTAEAMSIANRQGIDLILNGTIETQGSGYKIGLSAIDVALGETVAEESAVAKNEADVFRVVAEIAAEVRKKLGDNAKIPVDETNASIFFAATFEAASHYIEARYFAASGDHETATQWYRRATESDPNLGRAYAAWAMSSFQLGRVDEAQQLWARALALADTMTAREYYRALGQYHFSIANDSQQAVENLQQLVSNYPADATGHEQLAAAAFESLDFEAAARAIESAIAIYPNSERLRAAHARYSMFAGNFEVAQSSARAVLEVAPNNTAVYLPLAVAAMVRDDIDAASGAYRELAEVSDNAASESAAALGLSDIEIYSGNFDVAKERLLNGIASDLSNDNRDAAATKYVALAETQLATGDLSAAEESADSAQELSSEFALRTAVAIVYLQTGNVQKVGGIAARWREQSDSQSNSQWRAYGLMLNAMILRSSGEFRESINQMRDALKLADLWLIRFQLAQTYLRTEQFAEALDEFTIAEQRRGEAAAAFFDGKPTYRYLATLPYWIGRAQDGLNMRSAAQDNYTNFLARWSESGPLMDDSRKRLQSEQR